MAAEADIIRYVITGEEDEIIPQNATQVSVHPSVRIIPDRAFEEHQNIIELFCHDGLVKIGLAAFRRCHRLKRVILLGVEIIEEAAFQSCFFMEYIECEKLEMIGECAFSSCECLGSINLPSVEVVGRDAFGSCTNMTNVKFGRKLESIEERAFCSCFSIERISLPLKLYLINSNDAFIGCFRLNRVDLIDRAEMQVIIDALHLLEWRDDLDTAIENINEILPGTDSGLPISLIVRPHAGRKALVIDQWLESVIQKMIDYEAKHQSILAIAATTLQLALPNDIVKNNILTFLELPMHMFEFEDESVDGTNSSSSSHGSNDSHDDFEWEEYNENEDEEQSQYNCSEEVNEREDNESEDIAASEREKKRIKVAEHDEM